MTKKRSNLLKYLFELYPVKDVGNATSAADSALVEARPTKVPTLSTV